MRRRTFTVISLFLMVMLTSSSCSWYTEGDEAPVERLQEESLREKPLQGESLRELETVIDIEHSYVSKQVDPPIRLTTKLIWYTFQTEYFQVYYYESEDYVKEYAKLFDDIHNELFQQFSYFPTSADDRMKVYFLLPSDYKEIGGRGEGRYVFGENVMNINLVLEQIKDSSYEKRLFTHELIHAITLQSVNSRNFPIWFMEAIAEYHEHDNQEVAQLYYKDKLRTAVEEEIFLQWDDSNWYSISDRSIPYAEVWSIWSFLIKRYGDEKLISIFFNSSSFLDQIEGLAEKSLSELEEEWKQDLIEQFQ